MLDIMLSLHAEHGGGNNSTFTTRVLSSSDTDPYSTYAAAFGSLKGHRHGGANHQVRANTSGVRRSTDFSRFSSASYSVPAASCSAKRFPIMARGSESV